MQGALSFPAPDYQMMESLIQKLLDQTRAANIMITAGEDVVEQDNVGYLALQTLQGGRTGGNTGESIPAQGFRINPNLRGIILHNQNVGGSVLAHSHPMIFNRSGPKYL